VPPLRLRAPWVASEICSVVERGLSREPRERWSSVDELVTALERLTGSAEDLELASLCSVEHDAARAGSQPPEIDSQGPKVSERPSLLDSSAMATDFTAAQPRETARRRSWSRTAAWSLAALAIALFGAVWPRRPLDAKLGLSPTLGSAVAADGSAARVSATLSIVPTGARVTVDGRLVEHSGTVVLRGTPGQIFVVVASFDGRDARARVVLTSERTAIPGLLEVAPATSSRAERERAPPPARGKPPTSATEPAASRAPAAGSASARPDPLWPESWP
jgi:hypothetical protein